MANGLNEKITYLGENSPSETFSYIRELPDTCPVCSYAVSPEYILMYNKSGITSELLCGCPRDVCRALFFAVYEGTHTVYLMRCYPYSKVSMEFPEEISELSPEFVSIYNQAHHADKEGLDLICGVGYRKALEYLIKDYALKIYPEDVEPIKSMPLQQCVKKYISEPTIKSMAESYLVR